VLATILKNTTTYCFLQKKKLFMLIITSSKGWGIISFQKPYFLIKQNKIFFLFPHLKSYSALLSIIFLGFHKGYFQYLKLKGMGYKFILTSNSIVLKFGFSHRVAYINFIDTKCKFLTRYLLELEVRSL
jgi:hypothetical protein